MAVGNTRRLFPVGRVAGVLFILSAMPKVIGVQMAVDNFHTWMLGDTWRWVVAVVEILGGLAMFTRFERVGAVVLFALMPAAALVHIQFREWVLLPMPIFFGILILIHDRQVRP